MTQRIHILGVGNLGKYVAYGLKRSRPESPVTLIFHRNGLLADWEIAQQSIQYTASGSKRDSAGGFKVELLNSVADGEGPTSTAPSVSIKHLIVATKTYATVPALAAIKERLHKDSHILFLQNGMGVTNAVSEKVFPDPETRPTYWAGVCSAGVYNTSPFAIVHAGRGTLTVGVVEASSTAPPSPPPQSYMVGEVLGAKLLEASLVSPELLLQAQLRKLAINSIINPITALFSCKNGQLVDSEAKAGLFRSLLPEAGHIVRALLPPQLRATAKVDFSDDALRTLVMQVARSTAENTSSMLQDIQAGRQTEISHINGYLISQAEELGLPCQHNSALVQSIRQLEAARQRELERASELAKHRTSEAPDL